jgi:hypothetical protein
MLARLLLNKVSAICSALFTPLDRQCTALLRSGGFPSCDQNSKKKGRPENSSRLGSEPVRALFAYDVGRAFQVMLTTTQPVLLSCSLPLLCFLRPIRASVHPRSIKTIHSRHPLTSRQICWPMECRQVKVDQDRSRDSLCWAFHRDCHGVKVPPRSTIDFVTTGFGGESVHLITSGAKHY